MRLLVAPLIGAAVGLLSTLADLFDRANLGKIPIIAARSIRGLLISFSFRRSTVGRPAFCQLLWGPLRRRHWSDGSSVTW